ncbi:hypothetical protein HF908_11200 [Ralstonia pseudosolanacearum]|uniref:hypothetical protein n=1 Tax=Ralstonia pseudosolanacearum TaxID=1310165 RepID=UPI0018671DA0|nr:hypothetical protein [Ralstonia pseudosolanacearum]QOK91993.1 hypothetical protein HF908_11200 [Ralstonia pseudosolanacearum]
MKVEAIKETLQSAISTVTGQLSKFKEDLDATNFQIGTVEAQIQKLRGMPISLDDWGISLREFIRQKGGEYRPDLANRLMSHFRGDIPANKRPWEEFEDADGNPQAVSLPSNVLHVQDAEVVMCFYFPDVVHDRLMAHLRERIGGQWGNQELPTVEERRKLIAELTTRRDALVEQRAKLRASIDEISAALRS